MVKKKKDIDWGLKFYLEVLKLDSLHFGLWDESDTNNIEGMKKAQERYTRRLLGLIPEGVEKVLDAGSGTGAQSQLLYRKGFEVEALNPDPYQAAIFRSRLRGKVPLKEVKFEDYETKKKYDLILMSESPQYMDTDKMAARARQILRDGGFILLSDYFRKKAGDKYYSTCKVKERFIETLKGKGFLLEKNLDITGRVLPTLELGREIYIEYALPVLEIIGGYITSSHPVAAGAARKIFSKKLKKLSGYLYEHSLDKTDSNKFKEKLEYLFLLFKKENQS